MRFKNRLAKHRDIQKFLRAGCVVVFQFLFLAMIQTSAFGGESKAVSRIEVEDLIRALDANSLAERSRAERKLLEIGPEVLLHLPSPEVIESVAAREAIRRIRPQIERRAALESATASLITLQGEQTLGRVLAELEQQSRNRIYLAKSSIDLKDRKLVVNWKQMPFWNCLDDLCKLEKLQWQTAKDDAAIWISKVDPAQPAVLGVQQTGPYRLAIDSVENRVVIGNDREKLLRLCGRLAVEPRLRPLFISLNARDFSAILNSEEILSTSSPDAKYEFPVSDGSREIPIQWDFRLPVGLAAKSVSIRGRLHCQIAATSERIVFSENILTRGVIRRRGGVTVRIRHVTFEATDDGSFDGNIGITVSYDNGGPAFESHRTWIFHNAVYLESKTAGRIDFTDFDTTQQADGAVAVDYRWKKINPPIGQYSFVYEAPTLILDAAVDADIADIPIGE